MNKSEKAIIALLAAQLEVILANADAIAGGKRGMDAYVKKTAAARRIAEQYRKKPAPKARAPKKTAKHR